MSSSASSPTRATPLITPIVAGTPPLTRTTDSRSDARAKLSGYGKPGSPVGHRVSRADREKHTVCVYRSLQSYYGFPRCNGVLDLLRDLQELARSEAMVTPGPRKTGQRPPG